MPAKRLPEVVAVCGSNYVEVGFELGPVEGNERAVACFSAIDNLIKGGAGQAIQSMNIVLGLDEDATLADPGGYPCAIVVKLGGEVIASAALAAIARDVAVPRRGGRARRHRPRRRARRRRSCRSGSGRTPKKVAGRRVTDEAALDVIKMVVAGKLNVDLCAALSRAGAQARRACTARARALIEAVRRPPRVYAGAGDEPVDLGLVGDVTAVGAELLGLLARARLRAGARLPRRGRRRRGVQHQRRHRREPRRRRARRRGALPRLRRPRRAARRRRSRPRASRASPWPRAARSSPRAPSPGG